MILVLLTVCYHHVMYEFQTEFTLKQARSLSDSNEIRTHNHIVRKQTLNDLAKLAIWPVWLNG